MGCAVCQVKNRLFSVLLKMPGIRSLVSHLAKMSAYTIEAISQNQSLSKRGSITPTNENRSVECSTILQSISHDLPVEVAAFRLVLVRMATKMSLKSVSDFSSSSGRKCLDRTNCFQNSHMSYVLSIRNERSVEFLHIFRTQHLCNIGDLEWSV
jgi:hypothetical protein